MYREVDDHVIPAMEWMTVMMPLLEGGHMLKICPSGTSMYPFLHGGRDEAFLCSAFGKQLKRGDVVLYVRGDGTHILHRVHHIKGNEFFMLGDSHIWIEGPVDRLSILAVTTYFVRKGRKIQCGNVLYKILSRIWLILRPIRPFIFRLRKLTRTI